MKKSLKIVLVCLICLFLLPIFVFADMGAPDIGNYDVVISNKDGAKLYDYNYRVIGTIPYDTKIKVNYEYTYNGTMYGSVTYKGETGDIRLSDVAIYSTEIDLSKYDKIKNPLQLYVFGDDAYLYNGPSTVYGRVSEGTKIPAGEIVTYEYSTDAWVYVTYNGVKGWLLNYPYMELYADLDTSVASVATGDNKVLTIETIKSLVVDPSQPEKTISVNIPMGTEIEYDYYYRLAKSEYIYVEYGDAKGWLYVASSFYGEDTANATTNNECFSLLVTSDQLYVYKKMGDINSKTNKKIPYGTEAALIYSFVKDGYSWNQIYYDGHYYWFAEKSADYVDSFSVNYDYIYVYRLNKDLEMYEKPSKDAKKLGKTIKKDTSIEGWYSYYDESLEYGNAYYSWEYVEYDGVKGWIPSASLENVEDKDVCPSISRVEEDKKDDEEKEDEEEEQQGLSPKLIAALAIGGAVVLALVVLVVIRLVNKKKNPKDA